MSVARKAESRFLNTGQGGGFTLVEVMLALALLGGSLCVVAQVMVLASRVADASTDTTTAIVLAAQKVEQLRSLAWGVASDGTAVNDTESDLTDWPNRPTGGPGLALAPPGTLAVDTPGYVDYFDGLGRRVSSGGSPPDPAVFARRWSIEPSGPASPATLVLHVAVWRRTPRWAFARPGAPGWRPVVQLDAAKARRGE